LVSSDGSSSSSEKSDSTSSDESFVTVIDNSDDDSLVSEYFSSDNASISSNGVLNQAFVGLGVQANFVDSGIGSIVTFDSGFGSVSFVTFHSDNMSNFSSFVDSAISSARFSFVYVDEETITLTNVTSLSSSDTGSLVSEKSDSTSSDEPFRFDDALITLLSNLNIYDVEFTNFSEGSLASSYSSSSRSSSSSSGSRSVLGISSVIAEFEFTFSSSSSSSW